MALTSVVCYLIGNNACECISGSGFRLMFSVATITEVVMKYLNITVVSTEREHSL